MTIDSAHKAKRSYSTPKLVAYGDMAKLTKAGSGSIIEMSATSTNMMRFI